MPISHPTSDIVEHNDLKCNRRRSNPPSPGMLCELDHDLLGFVISLVCQHRILCICAQASSKLRTEARCVMRSRYADESVHVERIIGKLRLQECFHCLCDAFRSTSDSSDSSDHWHVPRPERSWKYVQFKSVEWLKHMLGWVDHDPSYRHHNDTILDSFYCDCRKCHRTFPCGRGQTLCMSTHEESLLNHHFQVKWWDECGF